MAGLGAPQPGAALLGGILYHPYYLFSFLVAGAIVWFGPSAWNFTQRLNELKAVVCLLLLWVSLVVLATQEYNPFIYFIF
jgi:alginate O-acetyltransferase complex protein AlgI